MTSTEAVRETIDHAREAMRAGAAAPDAQELAPEVSARLDERDRSNPRPLLVLAESAVEAATAAMRDAVAPEFDLSTGTRGERDDHVRTLPCDLTGAEDATVVNNNAAASAEVGANELASITLPATRGLTPPAHGLRARCEVCVSRSDVKFLAPTGNGSE